MAAGNATIGALRVVLGADTADLDKGLRSAQAGVAAFAGAIGGAVAVVTDKVIGFAGNVASSLQRTIDDMDKLNKTSQKLGIPVEQLSSLAYSADLADVSFEALSKGVGKLSKAMVEAAGKPTSDAANAFRALGVSVTDTNGKLKTSDTVMGDLADAFEGLKDGPGKVAVAMALFGKAGADLIPLLNGGRDSLKEMNDEAAKFGAVVSTQAAKQAEAFNDNMTRLGYAIKGVIVQTATQLLPTMVNASAAMVEWAKNSGVLETALGLVSTTIKSLVTGGVIVGAVLKSISDYVSTLSTSLGLLIKGEFSKAMESVKVGVSNIADTAKSSFNAIDGLWRGTVTGAAAAAVSTDEATRAQKDFNFTALAGKNAIDTFIDSKTKGLAGDQAQIQTFGLLTGAMEAQKLQLEALAIAKNNNTAITVTQQAQLDILKQKTSDYALTLAGLQMTQANLTPAQLFQQEQTKIQALFDAGELSAEAYGQAMDNAAQRANATWSQAGSSIAGSFKDIATAFGKENSAMAKAAQIFGAIQATISMFTGAAKALELPFPANLAAFAKVLATGASLVASIKSQQIPSGFKTGGSFTVGGTGGQDSQLVSMRVTPGEQVDVWRPGDGGADPRGGGGVRTIDVIGLGRDNYSRSEVARMMDAINEALGDGHQLNVKSA